MKEDIVSFYEDGKISRKMPGKKDYASIGRNIHKQKRFLLAILKELHSIFKSKYPARQIGFSKFCSLCSKWCVLPGLLGTHSVCECTHHQNMKLILAPLGVSHTELYEFLICDINSMSHRCPNCPKNTEMLESKLYELIGDYYDETVIEFSQWTSKDRANLTSCRENVPQFINLVIQELEKLAAHSVIAKCQSNLEENLEENKVILLRDFAENYSFVVQDELQGFH